MKSVFATRAPVISGSILLLPFLTFNRIDRQAFRTRGEFPVTPSAPNHPFQPKHCPPLPLTRPGSRLGIT